MDWVNCDVLVILAVRLKKHMYNSILLATVVSMFGIQWFSTIPGENACRQIAGLDQGEPVFIHIFLFGDSPPAICLWPLRESAQSPYRWPRQPTSRPPLVPPTTQPPSLPPLAPTATQSPTASTANHPVSQSPTASTDSHPAAQSPYR